MPLLYPIQRNAACFYHLMQYLRGRLPHSAISTDHLNKLIFQPAQISVRLSNIPPQAGEVCYQQEVNVPIVYRIRNLGQREKSNPLACSAVAPTTSKPCASAYASKLAC